MAKVILHITTSLDGFIADENGNSDFARAAEQADTGFAAFYDSVGSVVMGRKTYDYLKNRNAELFTDKDVFVITHYLRQKENNATFIHEDIMGQIEALKKQSGKDVWLLGGSEVVNILIKERLVDEIVLTTAPLILGTGTRLFKNDNPTELVKLVSTTHFGDYVQTVYRF